MNRKKGKTEKEEKKIIILSMRKRAMNRETNLKAVN